MGVCASNNENETEEERKLRAEAEQKTKNIEQQMTAEFLEEQQVYTLLLLGAGESGKSTIFRQINNIYGIKTSKEERVLMVPAICNNILCAMETLLEKSVKYGLPGPAVEESKVYVENILKLKNDDQLIDSTLARHLLNLWNDPGIQQTYDNRNRYQLLESTAYFMTRVDAIADAGYVPSEDDLLRARIRTTGIIETRFSCEGNTFRMFDVGGQRNERKKWIHCFQDVTAVLFVASLSGFNETLFEDGVTNRMCEAMNLFQAICASKWFTETAIILFLNKCDLFAEKMKRGLSLKECYDDYVLPPGSDPYTHGIDFIRDKFLVLNKVSGKQVFTHTTCATDNDNVHKVFLDVKHIVVARSLDQAGLL